MPTSLPRFVIVNADDLGLSQGVNNGVLTAHREGIVTSASLMVRWPAASEAVAACREDADLSLGLHVDLGEWAFRDGDWQSIYEVVPLDDHRAVEAEVRNQLARFCDLVGRSPTHLDSHQHVHCQDPVRSVLVELAANLQVPLRRLSPCIQYCGSFYGQTGTGEPIAAALATESLIQILSGLPPGITELSCHPGTGDSLNTMYRNERSEETRTLCDARVRRSAAEHRIEFISFEDVPALGGAARQLEGATL